MDAQTLRNFPLFSVLSNAEAEALIHEFEEQRLPEGTVLMAEGQHTEHIYLLVDGEVSVFKAMDPADERLLAVRGSGTLLGEMSIFNDQRVHTATVRARTPVCVLVMNLLQFDRLLQTRAEVAYSMLKVVSRRLEETDLHDIADLREKNRQLTLAYQELKAAQARLIEKEKLEHELQIAGNIQRSVLPAQLPKHERLDFGALMVPARMVGGDFYDLIRLSDHQIGVVVGDVCDKGMPAALYMALVYSALRLEAVKRQTPGDTLRAVNRHLKEISHAGMYVTLIYGILDLRDGMFRYVRAGHTYPLLLDQNLHSRELVGTIGQPLGMFWDVALDEQSIAIPPGGTLLIYSDGLSETIEARADLPELGPFCEQLMSAGGYCSAQELCERMWRSAGDEAAGHPPITDDFTVVAVQNRDVSSAETS